jgi:small subunit ribosomal protein S2e
MADRGATRGGFASRGGDRGGDRGRGGRGRGRGRRGPKNEEKEWQPVTKLGRLVKAGKIKSMEEIYLHSLPIKEYQIVDFFLPTLKDEVMKVRTHDMPRGERLLCSHPKHLQRQLQRHQQQRHLLSAH